MKQKTLACLISAALLFTLIIPAFADGAQYAVSSAYANVLPEPNAAALPIAVLPEGTVVTVTETQNDFGRITLRSGGITGWVYMGLLSYCGGEAQNTEKIKKIYISSLPKKTSYIEGEETFDPAGLTVKAAYADGKADAAIKGYRLYLPDFSRYGEKTAYVFYTAPGGAVFSASFTVTVTKVPIKAMKLLSAPDKTAYIEGQTLSLSGLKVRVSYTDGRADKTFTAAEILHDADFTVIGCHNETDGAVLRRGDHTVNVYYKYPKVNVSFKVTAEKKKLIGLEINTYPDSMITYSNTAAPDLTGLTLSAAYDNGITETILPNSCKITCDPAAFVLGPGNTVTVSYGGMSVTLDFTYALDTPVSLELITPKVLTFILGEPIDLTEMKAYLVYTSGEKKEIENYKLQRIDPALTGPQTVAVSYGEFSELLTVNISPYYRKGDVNDDAKVTTADARLALRAAVGFIRYTGNPLRAADVNRDGSVTTADARLILRDAVGLESLLDFSDIVKINKGVIYEAS